ncbi:MAG: thermonuclease family protein [Pseudomonadota bacterium]
MRICFIISLFICFPVYAAGFDGSARARVERVIDGDTIKMRVAIWLDQEILVSVRLADVDAPELFRPKCEEERRKAKAAKAFVETFLQGGEADLQEIERGKYAGRVVARIKTDRGDLSRALVAAGLGVDGRRGDWCNNVRY